MMINSWWWMWTLVMFFFLVPPVGYGWGYRGWGAPYPRYIQRRRGQRASAGQTHDHEAWGWGGDFVWFVAMMGLLWACYALWWH